MYTEDKMSAKRRASKKKPAQGLSKGGKNRSPASEQKAPGPEAKSLPGSESERLGRLPANDRLDQETLLHLQRQQGNAYVQRLVVRRSKARPSRRFSSEVIARRPDEPAASEALVRPNAADMVAGQYPGLKLPPATVALLQKILDARYNIKLLDRKAARYSGSILHDIVSKREAILRLKKPHISLLREHYYPRFDTEGLAINTATILGDDILSKDSGITIAERAFRSSLYKELISHKTILVINGGLSPRSLFKFMWGRPPVPWEFSHEGGVVNFLDLMKWVKFNLAYQDVLLTEALDVTEKYLETERSLGGLPYSGMGKKIGETYGMAWNTDVELGEEIGRPDGYYDDVRGHKELNLDFDTVKTARAVVKAPDGWLHIFSLNPAIMSTHMKEPGDDGYVYLLDKGAVVIPERIVTKDERELHRGSGKAGAGWRTHKTMSEVELFAVGAFFGDFIEDPSVTSLVGQMLIGVVPIAGQLADVRDVAAGVVKMWTTGAKDGKLQTFMALIGIVPLLGDGIKLAKKALAKGGRTAAIEAFTKHIKPGISDAASDLARKMKADPGAVAKALKITPAKLAKESRKLSALAATAVTKGGAEAAERYARKMDDLFSKVGGDASALVAVGGGSWARVAKALAASPTGSALGKKLQVWRIREFNMMEGKIKKAASGFGRDIPGGAPKMHRTGTASFKSDVDVSFMGPNATVHRNAAIDYMEKSFGPGWRELLDADVFADPRRMTMFEGPLAKLPPRTARDLEKRLITESELNVLAKTLMKGGDEAAVKEMAKKLGVKMKGVKARVKELKKLTKDKVAKLELELDILHRKFLEAKKPKEKALIAEEMATIQGKINAVVEGPYLTPGGVAKHVTRREGALRPKGPFKAMSPAMLYTAVLDDFYMLQKVLADVKKAGAFSEKTAKGMAKYAERLMVSAGEIGGIDVSKMAASKTLFETIEGLLRRSRLEKGAVPLADVDSYLRSAKDMLTTSLDKMISAAKKKSLEHTGKIDIDKMERVLLREMLILERSELRTRSPSTTSEE